MRTLAGTPRLILASASPARLKTLQAAGITADVIVSGVDESGVVADGPEQLCGTLAALKADAVATLLESGDHAPEAPEHQRRSEQPGQPDQPVLVLGCDSMLAFDGEVLGKPASPAEAIERWQTMRGRSGILYTGHCLIETVPGAHPGQPVGQRRLAEAVAATTVHFAKVTDEEIAAYVATGEPLRVAGAFTIDGLGGSFVERIEGDAGTVIGLSLPLLRQLLRSLDVEITALWPTSTT